MTYVVCDRCRKPIPYVKKRNLLGIEEAVLDRGECWNREITE